MSEIDSRVAEMVRANRLGISITELRRRTAEDREAGKRVAEAYRAALNGALAKGSAARLLHHRYRAQETGWKSPLSIRDL